MRLPSRSPRPAGLAARVAAAALLALAAACSSVAPPPPDDFGARGATPRPSKDQPKEPPVLTSGDAGVEESAETCETVPPNDRCGLAPQCGCGPNETCDVTTESTGATSCVTAGSATLGRPCLQTGDCVVGLTCQYGACRPYCDTPRTKCGAPGTDLCVEVPDDQGKPIANLAVCTIACDPREPQAVCGTNACHWFATFYAPHKVSDCNFGGPKKVLEPCESDSECQPGLVCIDHPSNSIGKECERWCRLGQAGDCPNGFSCVDVFGDAAPVIGGVKEGVCQD